MTTLLSYEDALALVTAKVRPLGRETVPLDLALGRYLARDVKARRHSPWFEQSAMDGFAVRTRDLPRVGLALDLVGEMPAGGSRRLTLRAGQTVKVFTGGRLPGGTDAVVMKEYVEADGSRATFTRTPAVGDQIRRVGEEYRRGEVILTAGTRITPPVIGVLASLGLAEVAVGRVPRVAVITMGDELIAPGEQLNPGCIHDANGPAMAAALRGCGVTKISRRRVGDTLSGLKRSLKAAMATSDLVITVGGASVGDHDHVGTARADLGVNEFFSRLAVKPGKPNYFGLKGRVPVFGLPGNPVSALVSFRQLVRPALEIMKGCPDPRPVVLPVALTSAVSKEPGRLDWSRATMATDGTRLLGHPVTRQGSHMLSGLVAADLLLELPRDAEELSAGDTVQAHLLDWGC